MFKRIGRNFILTIMVLVLIMPFNSTIVKGEGTRDTVYVIPYDENIPDDGDGSEEKPYQTITKGISMVKDGGTVSITAGTYYEHLTIEKNVTLMGNDMNSTIIDGTNSGRVITITADVNVTINGVTIQNGRAKNGNNGANGQATHYTTKEPTKGDDGYNGGGIYNQGKLIVTNCKITNNRAGDGGEGGRGEMLSEIAAQNGKNGGNGGNGGGIYNENSLFLTNCIITNNNAGNGNIGGFGGWWDTGSSGLNGRNGNSGNGGNGGGIYNKNNMAITNCIIVENNAGNGAIGQEGVPACYPNDRAGDGSDGGHGGHGGGIYNQGILTTTSSSIVNNKTGDGGKGGFFGSGNYLLCAPAGDGGNGGIGGGISNYGALTITTCILKDNNVGQGGQGGQGAVSLGAPWGNIGNDGVYKGIYSNDITASLIGNNNWWGSNEGPEAEDTNLDVSKWLVLNITMKNQMLINTTNTISGDLTKNNMGEQINNTITGVEVAFEATNGTIESSAYMIDGVATVLYIGTVTEVVTITATLDNETITKNVTIEPMDINEVIPIGKVNRYYEASFSPIGGTEPYTWSVTGNIPDGLNMKTEEGKGIISGIPTKEGIYNIEVTITNNNDVSVRKKYTITIILGSGNGAYLITPATDNSYTVNEKDFFPEMTVNAGVTGFKYFAIDIEKVLGHDGNEVAVFTHYRNNAQIGITAIEADFEVVNKAKVAFNVQPGDVIKVFVVDDLTNDISNPLIL